MDFIRCSLRFYLKDFTRIPWPLLLLLNMYGFVAVDVNACFVVRDVNVASRLLQIISCPAVLSLCPKATNP